jgi:hypothetical protein
LETAGYPVARAALNSVLERCAERLTPSDFDLAYDVLGVEEEPPEKFDNLLLDTALYSRPGDRFTGTTKRRAIDRLAPKAAAKGDRLQSFIAEKLPTASCSVFQTVRVANEETVLVRNLVDGGRQMTIKDRGLAASASAGTLFAGRFLDLGPWSVGFGVISTLRRSEAAAILIVLSPDETANQQRDCLHELLYACRINDLDLVMTAIEPLIAAVAFTIETSSEDLMELVDSLKSIAMPSDEAIGAVENLSALL